MIRVSQLKLSIPHTKEQLEKKLVRQLHIRPEELISYQIRRQSLDARKKPELFYVYTVDVKVKNEAMLLKHRGTSISGSATWNGEIKRKTGNRRKRTGRSVLCLCTGKRGVSSVGAGTWGRRGEAKVRCGTFLGNRGFESRFQRTVR